MMDKGLNYLKTIKILIGIFVTVHAQYYEGTNCDRNYIGELRSGVIASPNFPFNYHGLDECSYKIFMPSRRKSTSIRTAIGDVNIGLPGEEKRFQICFVFNRFRLPYSDRCTEGPSLTGDYLMFPGTGIYHGPRLYCYKGASSPKPEQLNNVWNKDFCWEAEDEIFEVNFISDREQTDIGFYATFTITEIGNEQTVLDGDVQQENNSTVAMAPCGEEDETCHNRQCVPSINLCDGIPNCADGSDEDYTTARCPDTQSIEACNFEEEGGSFCEFSGNNWILGQSAPRGPKFDHTFLPSHGGYNSSPSGGHFMYTEFGPTEARWYAYPPTRYSPRERCLSFWYYMIGDCGQLNVYVNTVEGNLTKGMWRPVWQRGNHQGHAWLQGQIRIAANTELSRITFEGVRGLEYVSNIGLDDISITEGPCYGDDISCRFELPGLCGWYNEEKSYLKWKRHAGRNGGASNKDLWNVYLMVNGSDESNEESIRLYSPTVSNHLPSAKQCLTFKYMMHGQKIAWFLVRLVTYQGDDSLLVFRRHLTETAEGQWQSGAVTIEMTGPYQIVLEVFRYPLVKDDNSVAAVDDIVLTQGGCPSDTSDNVDPDLTTTTPSVCMRNQFRCQDGQCISDWLRCDGRFDCSDFSDESGCEFSSKKLGHQNVGLVMGIVAGVAFVVIVVMAFIIVCSRKRRQDAIRERDRRHMEMSSSWREATSGMLTLTNIGDPPPLYTEEEGQGQRGRLTLSVSWEPPPVYDIAIVATPYEMRPERPPSYDSHDRGRDGAGATGSAARGSRRDSSYIPQEGSTERNNGSGDNEGEPPANENNSTSENLENRDNDDQQQLEGNSTNNELNDTPVTANKAAGNDDDDDDNDDTAAANLLKNNGVRSADDDDDVDDDDNVSAAGFLDEPEPDSEVDL